MLAISAEEIGTEAEMIVVVAAEMIVAVAVVGMTVVVAGVEATVVVDQEQLEVRTNLGIMKVLSIGQLI